MSSKIIVSRIVKCVVSNYIQISILVDVFPLQYLSNKINYSISDFCSGYGCGNKLNVYTIYSSMQKVIYASFETDTFFRIIGFISIVITFLYHFPHHVHIFHNIMLGNVQIGEFYFCLFTQYQGRNRFTDTLERHRISATLQIIISY